MIVRGVSRK